MMHATPDLHVFACPDLSLRLSDLKRYPAQQSGANAKMNNNPYTAPRSTDAKESKVGKWRSPRGQLLLCVIIIACVIPSFTVSYLLDGWIESHPKTQIKYIRYTLFIPLMVLWLGCIWIAFKAAQKLLGWSQD